MNGTVPGWNGSRLDELTMGRASDGSTVTKCFVSRENVFRGYCAIWCECNPFKLQERSFHGASSLETTERTVCPDRPVTGNDYGKGIPCKGGSHRPGTALPEMTCNSSIRVHLPPGNSMFGPEHRLLKRRAFFKHHHFEIKGNVFPHEKSPDLEGKLLDLCARSFLHAGKPRFCAFSRSDLLVREENTPDLDLSRKDLPHNA